MFFGASLVIAFMADGDDDAGLVVFPAMGHDPGALAQLRARTIGCNQQAGSNARAIGQRHVDAVDARFEVRDRGRAQLHALLFGARHQRIDQMTVFDHVGERLARLDVAAKGQEYRTDGVVEPGIGDDHVEHGLRGGRHVLPDAEHIEQPTAGGDDSRGARVAARPGRQRRIGHDHANIRTEPLPQRHRQRQPGEGAPANHDASLCRHAVLPGYTTRLCLLPDYSWAKQIGETRAVDPPVRHSGICRQARPRIDRVPVLSVKRKRPMSKSLIDLLTILDLEPLEVNLFRGNSPKTSWQRVLAAR